MQRKGKGIGKQVRRNRRFSSLNYKAPLVYEEVANRVFVAQGGI